MKSTTFIALTMATGAQSFLVAPTQHRATGSSQLRVVADAETEGLRSNRHEDEDSSSWTKTKDGNFLPNLGVNKLFRGRQQASRLTKPNILEIEGIHEYKREVVDEEEQMVCVRFYATWCRACKAVGPAFRRLPDQYPNIKFVEVPVTEKNKFLHQGLGIPSLPYAHLYHPEVGLVEERKIGKNNFKEFRDEILKSYVDGFCDIPEEQDQQEETELN